MEYKERETDGKIFEYDIMLYINITKQNNMNKAWSGIVFISAEIPSELTEVFSMNELCKTPVVTALLQKL